ncbi:MAG TPA: hypothetical protein VGB55_08950 [Tepidisphaeraceae bacterium]
MNVANLLSQFSDDVPIVPAPGLPEPRLSVAAAQAGQNRRVERPPARQHLHRERPLQGRQERRQGPILLWKQDQVNVLGHDHPGEEMHAFVS